MQYSHAQCPSNSRVCSILCEFTTVFLQFCWQSPQAPFCIEFAFNSPQFLFFSMVTAEKTFPRAFDIVARSKICSYFVLMFNGGLSRYLFSGLIFSSFPKKFSGVANSVKRKGEHIPKFTAAVSNTAEYRHGETDHTHFHWTIFHCHRSK